MISQHFMEKESKAQHHDRLRKAEMARLFNSIDTNPGSRKTKLAVTLSGAVLIVLMIAQLVSV